LARGTRDEVQGRLRRFVVKKIISKKIFINTLEFCCERWRSDCVASLFLFVILPYVVVKAIVFKLGLALISIWWGLKLSASSLNPLFFFTFSQKTEHLFENSSNMSHDLGQPRSIFAGVKRKTSVNHVIN
jgi:hypothetical protein